MLIPKASTIQGVDPPEGAPMLGGDLGRTNWGPCGPDGPIWPLGLQTNILVHFLAPDGPLVTIYAAQMAPDGPLWALPKTVRPKWGGGGYPLF